MQRASVHIAFVQSVLANVAQHGLDAATLLRHHRITPSLLLQPSARVSVARFADLQVGTMAAMGDEALGYAERPMPMGTWAMMCHAVISCDTLGQAMARYARFYRLFDVGPIPNFSSEQGHGLLSWQLGSGQRPPAAYLYELQLFNVHRFASWLIQDRVPVNRVELPYDTVSYRSEYARLFPGAQILFNSDRAALHIPLEPTTLPIRQTPATLHRLLRHPTLSLLTQRWRAGNWADQVRRILIQDLTAIPELNTVAQRLRLHPQTLRRRLISEGTSFKDLKNQVRRDTALHYLSKRGLSVEDIAYRAGFSEASAFIRAFKGWTGTTPYAYRKGL